MKQRRWTEEERREFPKEYYDQLPLAHQIVCYMFWLYLTTDGAEGWNPEDAGDMESLIGSLENMPRERLLLLMETERIGNSTLEQMGRQREQLLGADANIMRTREIAVRASRVLTELGRKSFTNKIVLYVLVGTLSLALTRWLGKHQ